MDNNIMYAFLAAMSGNSKLAKKDRVKEALLASFTSGNNPMSVFLNSKKFIERAEAKVQTNVANGEIASLKKELQDALDSVEKFKVESKLSKRSSRKPV